MIYVERSVRPELRSVWYCRVPGIGHARERVLPNGCMQILVNLAVDCLTDCRSDGVVLGSVAGALVMGARMRYEIVDTRDMEEIAGAVLRPGEFGAIFRVRADLLRERSVSVDDLWEGGGSGMRERVGEARTPEGILMAMEACLMELSRAGVGARGVERAVMVREAISLMRRPGRSVRECAELIGVSERRLHHVFREVVGLGLKGMDAGA